MTLDEPPTDDGLRLMGDNLFLSLRSFIPTPERNPGEQYLTEVFAWVLRRNEGLGRAFLEYLMSRLGVTRADRERPLLWRTQVPLGASCVDMVCEWEDGAFLFEHRAWCDESDDSPRLALMAAEHTLSGTVVTVHITAALHQQTQPADIELLWSDVQRFVENWLKVNGSGQLVEEFLEFLREQGLGVPAPVSHESILCYRPGQRLVPGLERLFRSVAYEIVVEDLAGLWKILGGATRSVPRVLKPRWGRVGLDFPSQLRPGVFVGVLLDGADHLVKLSNEKLGPDFCLIMDFHPQGGSPSLSDYVHAEAFSRLRTRLGKHAGPYEFVDHYFSSRPRHELHPLLLRRPLLQVLGGSMSAEDQKRLMKAEILRVIEVLLQGGELELLANRFSRAEHRQAGAEPRELGLE